MNGNPESQDKANGGGGSQSRPWLKAGEAAAELGVSDQTIYRLVHRKEIKGVLVGHLLRISRDSLTRYLERRSWSPALCAVETSRPRAGRRRRKPVIGASEAHAAVPGPTLAQ